MLRILESQFISYLADGLVSFQYPFLGKLYNLALDIFLRSFSCLLFNQVAEIIRRKTYLVGKVIYRGQPFFHRRLSLEIFIQQMFEPYDNIFVYLVAGDKLSFVETHTVIKQ